MTQAATLVLGIGNLLWADEGFGVQTVRRMDALYRFPESVRLMDGGTQGLYLLPYIEAAGRLLIFDAVDYGLPPGSLHIVEGDEVPRFLGAKKMSLHQTGFQEVLALASLNGHLPEAIVLIGVQPEELDDFGGPLRACVATQIEPAIAEAVARLETWGVAVETRREGDNERSIPDVAVEALAAGSPMHRPLAATES